MLSSWGDELEFGLTEIQLFDAKGRWIILRAESLSVEGALEEAGKCTVRHRGLEVKYFDKHLVLKPDFLIALMSA